MATSQPRVLHYAELRHRGWTDGEIKTALRRQRLVRIVKGTYLDTTATPDPVELIRAIADRSPDFVVSHRSAAIVHGLPLRVPDRRPVDLTHHRGGPGRRQPFRVVHSGRLRSHEITRVGGVQVTTVARTLVDLARTLSMSSAVGLADHVLHHGLAPDDEIMQALQAQHHVRGLPAARRALAFADGRAESPGESLLRVALDRCGIEPPELQVLVLDDDGRTLARADAGHVDDNALYEYDGRIKYSEPWSGSGTEALLNEKNREDVVRSRGRAMGRFTAEDLNDLGRVRDKVERTRTVGRALLASGAVVGRLVPAPPRKLPLSLQ